MATPLPLPSTPAVAAAPAIHEATPLSSVPSVTTSADTTAADGAALGELAYWAEGLLSAVIAADTSDEGEPVLAAAGNAATAALLLVQYHQQHDGDLREMFDVSADQLAIVRELLHTTAAEPTATQPTTAPVPTRPARERARRETVGQRRGKRRLRLVRSFAR